MDGLLVLSSSCQRRKRLFLKPSLWQWWTHLLYASCLSRLPFSASTTCSSKAKTRKQFKGQRFTIHSEQTCIVEIFFDMIRFVVCNGVTIEIDDQFRKAHWLMILKFGRKLANCGGPTFMLSLGIYESSFIALTVLVRGIVFIWDGIFQGFFC